MSNLVPLIQKMVPIQKPAPRPPVAVVGPSTIAAPSVRNAAVAQPAQAALTAQDVPDGIADNRMEEDNEYLLDLPDPDSDE